jgi:transcriptional regulator with XRE-family HTH domain
MALFAERLKTLREAQGLTQEDLAERAGMHRMGLAKLEHGSRKPTWETVQALAKALGVDCTAFQEGEPPPATKAKPKGKKKA